MNNDAIKVVKRNKKVIALKTRVVINPVKIESDVHQNLVDTVENWISERRENSRLEKVFSADRISTWKDISQNG